jgi:hypothetical protein
MEGSRLELTITGFWDVGGVENEMQKRAEEDEEGRNIRILKD